MLPTARKSEKGVKSRDPNHLILLVRPAGFEPAAYGLEDREINIRPNDFNNLGSRFCVLARGKTLLNAPDIDQYST